MAEQSRGGGRLDDKRRKEIAKMRDKGMSLVAIGLALDPPVTAPTVHTTLKRMGMGGRVKLAIDNRIKKASN